MEVIGKIVKMLPVQSGQGKNGTWKKQEFIVETQDQYPKKICIAAWGDKINLSSFSGSEIVKVSFDIESREYNGKWYTDAKAWKIERIAGDGPAENNNQQHPEENFNLPPEDIKDDLPF